MKTRKAPSSATVSWDTSSRRAPPDAQVTRIPQEPSPEEKSSCSKVFVLHQISTSVRSALITATCTPPASTSRGASSAAAAMAGRATGSSASVSDER